MRTWIIGSGEGCDIVVAQPRVSRRHCRFTELGDGYLVEDLGSSNGTYVNGERIAAEARVTPGDAVTLGALVPMPWPPTSGVPGATVLRIGRAPDNDVVLDDARVSSHHARLLVSGTRTLIEDVGSSNGTFLNGPDRRLTEATPLAATDTVFFGSLAVPAARLLPVPSPRVEAAAAPPPVPAARVEVAPAPPPVLPAPPEPPPARPTATSSTGVSPGTIFLLAQAPVLAILIVMAFGRPAGAAIAEGIASTMFALAMSAVWLGGTLAAWAAVAGRPSPGRADSLEARILAPMPRRLAALGGLALVQCAVMLAIVYLGSGMEGPAMPMFGVLLLTAAVGLALGWAVFAMIRSPMIAGCVLALAFLAMVFLGGRIRPLPDSGPVATVAAAMPSRWAFEGLLLLEAERQAPPDVGDLAEPFFPAATDRMGPRADAMALGFMLIGLAGAAAFAETNGKAAR